MKKEKLKVIMSKLEDCLNEFDGVYDEGEYHESSSLSRVQDSLLEARSRIEDISKQIPTKNRYEITYWEKETVWVQCRTIVETDYELDENSEEELLKEVIEDDAVDYAQRDYNWETSEHVAYDFDEVEIERIENENK